MPTQPEVATAIVQQLRLLDPAISAEVGTPERKIIDVVSQQIAERSIDLNQIQGVLDLDAKFGSDLDNFLGLFRFGRQQGAYATSFVTFSRNTISSYDIPIPNGTVVLASGSQILFQTTSYAVLVAGSTSITVPVRCVLTGTRGNVAIGEINSFGPSNVAGITTVSNEVPGVNGVDQETDAAFKVRFKNTVFRNVSGTSDQYLALAVATQGTTKANVVGPISRHLEYIQVPEEDDSDANGTSGEWTSALSVIPFSKHVYADIPYYVTDGGSTSPYFLRRDIDYKMNVLPTEKNRGDAYRGGFSVTDTSAYYRPNVTFGSVLSADADPAIDGLRPGKVVLFEHSYMSDSSRNDYPKGVLNCVDVFINGINEVFADNVLPRPSVADAFVNDPSGIRHYNNFRRLNEPERRPVIGNLFQPLFSQPSRKLPETLVVGDDTYLLGVHYWAVQDVSELGGTVRARNGIEWNPNIPARRPEDASAESANEYTGNTILEIASDAIIEVYSYTFNRNLIDLQSSLEGDKQVTTDVLAHEATKRRFKVDVAVMYSSGFSSTSVNSSITTALQNHFQSQYFGSVIQLSDILSVIHNVPGVDNVRWSRDLLSGPVDSDGDPRFPVIECDSSGRHMAQAMVDRIQEGSDTRPAIDQVYLTDHPAYGTFSLSYSNVQPITLPYDATTQNVEDSLNNEIGPDGPTVSVSGSGTPEDPWKITWSENGSRNELASGSRLWGDKCWTNDFALKDDELPDVPDSAASGDSTPGAVVRIRAQSTWNRV